jgi:peptidoglycan hydrolase CwlO-like protein
MSTKIQALNNVISQKMVELESEKQKTKKLEEEKKQLKNKLKKTEEANISLIAENKRLNTRLSSIQEV